MAIFPRMTLLAIAAVTAVALSGCLAPTPEPAPSPVPSADSVFASEEEALAAATEAYAAYLEVSDQILAAGGAEPERLLDVVTEPVSSEELIGIREFSNSKWHLVGKTQFDSVRVQQYSAAPKRTDAVTIYLCVDVAGVDVLDENGMSVVAATRPDRTPFEASFDSLEGQSLILSSKSTWAGDDFC